MQPTVQDCLPDLAFRPVALGIAPLADTPRWQPPKVEFIPSGRSIVGPVAGSLLMFKVLSGRIMVELASSSGAVMLIETLGAGELTVLTAAPTPDVAITARAIEPTQIQLLEKSAGHETLDAMGVGELLPRLARMQELMAVLAFGDARSRVLLALSRLLSEVPSRRSANRSGVLPTQSAIASLTGLSREQVNRVIVTLRRTGVLARTEEGFVLNQIA